MHDTMFMVLNTESKAQGLARPSYASARLQEMDPNGDLKRQERTIRNTSSQVNVGELTRRLLKDSGYSFLLIQVVLIR